MPILETEQIDKNLKALSKVLQNPIHRALSKILVLESEVVKYHPGPCTAGILQLWLFNLLPAIPRVCPADERGGLP